MSGKGCDGVRIPPNRKRGRKQDGGNPDVQDVLKLSWYTAVRHCHRGRGSLCRESVDGLKEIVLVVVDECKLI